MQEHVERRLAGRFKLAPDDTVHVVVATEEVLDKPDDWKPFRHKKDYITISDLLHGLPEHDDLLKEVMEIYERPKPIFHFVEVQLDDFKRRHLSRIRGHEIELSIVWDVLCEANVVTKSEYRRLLDKVAEPERRPRQYFVVADRLSEKQKAEIADLVQFNHPCWKCSEKRDFVAAFRLVWLRASTELMDLKAAKRCKKG